MCLIHWSYRIRLKTDIYHYIEYLKRDLQPHYPNDDINAHTDNSDNIINCALFSLQNIVLSVDGNTTDHIVLNHLYK